MPSWTVRGAYYARRGYWQTFTHVFDAASGEAATERAFSHLGGCHGVKRHQVRIDQVEVRSTA